MIPLLSRIRPGAKAISTLFILVVLLLNSRMIFGQEPSACREVLQKTEVAQLDTLSKKLAYLRLIETNEDWQHATSAAGGLSAIYDDIPFKATADYSDFQKWQQSVLNETKFNLDDQETHSLQTSFLPPTEIDAWKECMKIKAGGLALAVEDVTPTTARIHFYWVKPSSVPGTAEVPVSITPGAGTQGGSLHTPWPHGLGKVTTDIDETLTYSRDPNRELIVDIEVADGNGHHTSGTARVLADPKYNASCKFDLSGFQGIAHGERWDFPACTGLAPGKHVTAALTGAFFKIDAPHAIWIILSDAINSETADQDAAPLMYIGINPGDPLSKANDDAPKPWGFSHAVTVPWDGIVNVSLHVIRAQVFPGNTSSLSATAGTLEIK